MRHLYSILFYLLTPLLLLRLLWRSRGQPGYRERLAERLGFVAATHQDAPLWIHAVSVGEVEAVAPLVQALLAAHPDLPVLLSTTTPTGATRARARFGDTVSHCYLPWDTPTAVTRALQRVRPRAVCLVETELWPNLVHHCGRREIPVLLVNARLSERSAARYRRAGPLARDLFAGLAQVACRGDDDAARLASLGVAQQRLVVTGNLKFDAGRADSAALARELAPPGDRLLVAGSTHPPEEALVLDAFALLRRDYPDSHLLLAPRHPERAAEVAALGAAAGWVVQRRSAGGAWAGSTDILLLDTLGELAAAYGLGQVAFIGGSLVDHGGQNPLEAAACGVPACMGPSRENFAGACEQLAASGALCPVQDAASLARAVSAWFDNPDSAARSGVAGREVVNAGRGAVVRTLSILEEVVPGL